MFMNQLRRNFSKKVKPLESPRTPRRKGIKLSASVFLGCVGLYAYTNSVKTKLNLLYTATDKNIFLIGQIRELTKKYTSTFYLPMRIMEMIVGSSLERPPFVKTQEERLKLKDGDYIDLEWTNVHVTSEDENPERLKVAIVLGSMAGANGDTYSRHTIEQLYKNGFRTVFVHWRHAKLDVFDEEEEPVNGFASFTDLGDVDQVVNYVHETYPEAPVYLVGMSMGGNMWLRWAAANKALVTIGGVISFKDCIEGMSSFVNLPAGYGMMKEMKKITRVYKDFCKEKDIDVNWSRLNSFFATPETYMNEFYFKVHNSLNPRAFPDNESIYSKIDATSSLKDITIPTMLITAKNDPTRVGQMPIEEIRNNENLILVETPRGAHMEFMVNYGRNRWYKKVMSKFLNAVFDFEDMSGIST